MVPVVNAQEIIPSLREGVHAYRFRVTSDSPHFVHIMVPVVVIHHFRVREREREREREIETVKMELYMGQCYLPALCELPQLEGMLVSLTAG